jgi:hypothetical protein
MQTRTQTGTADFLMIAIELILDASDVFGITSKKRGRR